MTTKATIEKNCQDGHDLQTVGVIDTEFVNGRRYEVLLIECLNDGCGYQFTELGSVLQGTEWED